MVILFLAGSLLTFGAGIIAGRYIESDDAFKKITMAENETRYYRSEAKKYRHKAKDLELALKRCKEELDECEEKVM